MSLLITCQLCNNILFKKEKSNKFNYFAQKKICILKYMHTGDKKEKNKTSKIQQNYIFDITDQVDP